MQELIKAIRKGDLALVNQALEKLSYKVDFSKNIFGNTILHIAASSGNEKVFKLLLGLEGSNINITNKSGNTVLHSAVLYNHQEIIKEIFNYTGKDFINVANGDKQTALYYAADYKMLDTLIKAGAEFNIKDKDGISPLTNFAYKGDIASVKLLLEKKAEVTEETLEKAVYGLVRGQENISGSMEVLKILKSQFKKSELDEISQKLKKEYGKEYAYSTVEIILASEKESHFTSL